MKAQNDTNRILIWLFSLIIIAFVITNFEVVLKAFNYLINIVKPIIWALVIAYLINPVLRWFELKFKFGRGISVAIIYIFLILIIAGILMIIIPMSYNSSVQIINDIPTYSNEIEKWVDDRFKDVQTIERLAKTYNLSLESIIPSDFEKRLNDLTNNAQNMLLSFGGAIFSFTSGLFKFIMGLILSIYLLLEKENIAGEAKRIVRAFWGEKKAVNFFELLHEIDSTFAKYLVGKTLDSIIIGMLCFVGLSILQVRYAVLFSLVVAVTNMIPYFGPFIGAIPLVVVTLFYSPIQALWVAIFILLLQQADGNFIGPLILGGQVGVSPILIIIAVIIGGGLFGVVGMLLCVPVVAVLKNVLTRYVDSVVGEKT